VVPLFVATGFTSRAAIAPRVATRASVVKPVASRPGFRAVFFAIPWSPLIAASFTDYETTKNTMKTKDKKRYRLSSRPSLGVVTFVVFRGQ
jgi:hypothetical protein